MSKSGRTNAISCRKKPTSWTKMMEDGNRNTCLCRSRRMKGFVSSKINPETINSIMIYDIIQSLYDLPPLSSSPHLCNAEGLPQIWGETTSLIFIKQTVILSLRGVKPSWDRHQHHEYDLFCPVLWASLPASPAIIHWLYQTWVSGGWRPSYWLHPSTIHWIEAHRDQWSHTLGLRTSAMKHTQMPCILSP